MIAVRAAATVDIPGIVEVHEQAFPGFFLTSLGRAFLTRFYAAVVSESECIGLVAVDSGSVVGFVVGLLRPTAFFRRLLLRSGVGFVIDAAPAIARRPWYTIRPLLRGLKYRGDAPHLYPGAALVSSIAVRPTVTGSGAAGALLEAFCSQAAERRMEFVYLMTDRDSNEAANRFYSKHGFARDTEVARRDGRVMIRYVRPVGTAGPRRPNSGGVVDVERA